MAPFSDSVRDQYNRPVLGATVGIYTPAGVAVALYTASGGALANPMLVDALANYEFYAEDGKYRREIRLGSLLLEASDIIVGDPPEYVGKTGDPGPAGNVAATLDQLQSAPITNGTMIAAYDGSGSPMTWTTGDFTAQAAERPQDYVQANGIPLTTGAWVRQGADSVRVAGVATLAAQTRFDELEVYAQLKAGNTPAQNLTALKAAISYVAGGGTVIIPKGDFTIDCTGGYSAAAIIDKRLTLRVDGRIRMNDGGRRANPATLLRVDADNVTIEGNGTFQGDGSFDSVNDQTTANFPRLIDVTGKNAVIRGVTIAKAPKVGIFLRNAVNAQILGCDFVGGPSTYTDTSHFGIRTEGGSAHRIEGNNVAVDEAGGKTVQFVFGGGPLGATPGLIIDSNRALGGVWEKIAYLFGDNHRVSNNQVTAALKTDVIRLNGSYCSVVDNFGTNVVGVCTAYDGHDNIIARNRFDTVKQTGIVIGRNHTDYVGGFDRTRIVDNVLRADPMAGARTNGIQIYLEGSNSATDIDVIGNTISVFADENQEALILVRGISPCQPKKVRINDNKLSNCVNAIIVRNVSRYEVRRNVIDSTAGTPLVTLDSAVGLFEGNRGLESIGVAGISGFSPVNSDVARNNQWSDAPLEIAVTIASGTNNTVVTLPAWVANNATFTVTRTNQAAGQNGKFVTATRMGGNLTVGHTDGSMAAADETYLIVVGQ